jgi:hypothetical protein
VWLERDQSVCLQPAQRLPELRVTETPTWVASKPWFGALPGFSRPSVIAARTAL